MGLQFVHWQTCCGSPLVVSVVRSEVGLGYLLSSFLHLSPLLSSPLLSSPLLSSPLLSSPLLSSPLLSSPLLSSPLLSSPLLSSPLLFSSLLSSPLPSPPLPSPPLPSSPLLSSPHFSLRFLSTVSNSYLFAVVLHSLPSLSISLLKQSSHRILGLPCLVFLGVW